jgi:hypothetical protein
VSSPPPDFRIGGPDVDALGMRPRANTDQAFWSKPADAPAGWMDDLSSEPVDDAETHALDQFAAGRNAPTDRVFHELREIGIIAPVDPDLASTGGGTGGTGEPEDASPPTAAATFDINAVSDDLLPSWNLDLG